jgi:hypothetical protein
MSALLGINLVQPDIQSCHPAPKQTLTQTAKARFTSPATATSPWFGTERIAHLRVIQAAAHQKHGTWIATTLYAIK